MALNTFEPLLGPKPIRPNPSVFDWSGVTWTISIKVKHDSDSKPGWWPTKGLIADGITREVKIGKLYRSCIQELERTTQVLSMTDSGPLTEPMA